MNLREKLFLENKRLLRLIVILLAIFGLGILLGIGIDRYNHKSQNDILGFQIRDKIDSNSLIKPLLLCGVGSTESEEYKSFSKDIKQIVDDKMSKGEASKISVYYRDLNTGHWTGVNADERYAPASMLKIPVMIAYYKLVETYPEILLKKILYDGSFDDNKAEILKSQKMIQPGKEYTIDELIKYMIVYSDNNATRLLHQNINESLLQDIYTDLEIPTPEKGQIDFMSAKIYSRFFRVLYNATYLDRIMSQRALGLLTQHDFPQGIISGLPSGTITAQKFGERAIYSSDGSLQTYELHDCGIVYYPSHPYMICIMTKGDDINHLEGVIQDVSRIIYQEVSRQYL